MFFSNQFLLTFFCTWTTNFLIQVSKEIVYRMYRIGPFFGIGTRSVALFPSSSRVQTKERGKKKANKVGPCKWRSHGIGCKVFWPRLSSLCGTIIFFLHVSIYRVLCLKFNIGINLNICFYKKSTIMYPHDKNLINPSVTWNILHATHFLTSLVRSRLVFYFRFAYKTFLVLIEEVIRDNPNLSVYIIFWHFSGLQVKLPFSSLLYHLCMHLLV